MSRFSQSCKLCEHGAFSWRRAIREVPAGQVVPAHQLPLLERTCTNCGNVELLGSDGSSLTSSMRALHLQAGAYPQVPGQRA